MKAPAFVVVIPDLPMETDVASVVPRFNVLAESTVRVPELVFHTDESPGVNVRVLPVKTPIGPLDALPIFTAPVEVPVLMFVVKFDDAFTFVVAPAIVAPALPVISCVEVNDPLFVVVTPFFPIEIAVASEVPRFKVAAESSVKFPAPVGVRRTEPAPDAVKFPAAKAKAILFDPAVVTVPPSL